MRTIFLLLAALALAPFIAQAHAQSGDDEPSSLTNEAGEGFFNQQETRGIEGEEDNPSRRWREEEKQEAEVFGDPAAEAEAEQETPQRH